MNQTLLSVGNPKTLKGQTQGYITFILHLSPATVAGVGNMCPKSTEGCRSACLNITGRGGMFTREQGTNMVQEARKRRTQWLVRDRTGFMQQLITDITRSIKYAEKRDLIPVFRLNGTSDLPWASYKVNGSNIFEHFPDVQFYDYTAVPNRFRDRPLNYHLTFSVKENNDADVVAAIAAGGNIAVVFDIKKKELLPASYMGLPVVDGDEHDLRFLDQGQVCAGLRLKGFGVAKRAARASGFARSIS